MKETILNIAKWHEETFPDATLDGQLEKYEEEKSEWLESKKKDLSELADMLIVAAGMTRFDVRWALECLADVERNILESHIHSGVLEAAVNKKMKKNRNRIWKKTGNGTFHHIGDDNEKE